MDQTPLPFVLGDWKAYDKKDAQSGQSGLD